MFRKYEKTFRIIVPQVHVKGKLYLSDRDLKTLLGGKCTVTEKLDGANIGIIRTPNEFRFQKRGSLVDTSEHEQFSFLKAWGYNNYEKLMKIPVGYIVYGEFLRCVHTVTYDKLPDWVCVFNVWDIKTQKYLNWDSIQSLCDSCGLATVPLIKVDYINLMELFNMIPSTSYYGSEPAEGIVVTNYRQQIRGKLVREEFVKHLEEVEHWRYQQVKYNQLKGESNESD